MYRKPDGMHDLCPARSANVEDNGPVGGSSEAGGLFLHVGLESGVMTRTEVDRVTGQVTGGACYDHGLLRICLGV